MKINIQPEINKFKDVDMEGRAIFSALIAAIVKDEDKKKFTVDDFAKGLNIKPEQVYTAFEQLLEQKHIVLVDGKGNPLDSIDTIREGSEIQIAHLQVITIAVPTLLNETKSAPRAKRKTDRSKNGKDEFTFGGETYQGTVHHVTDTDWRLNVWILDMDGKSTKRNICVDVPFIGETAHADAWLWFDDYQGALMSPTNVNVLDWARSLEREKADKNVYMDFDGTEICKMDQASFVNLVLFAKQNKVITNPQGEALPDERYDEFIEKKRMDLDGVIYAVGSARRYPFIDAEQPEKNIEPTSETLIEMGDYKKELVLNDGTKIQMTFTPRVTDRSHRFTLDGELNDKGHYIKNVEQKEVSRLTPELIEAVGTALAEKARANYLKTKKPKDD